MTPTELYRLKTQAWEKNTRAIIARDFSASRMNSTKWAEVIECLSELNLRYQIKFVDVPDKVFEVRNLWHVTGDWFDGLLSPFKAISIEWLDINPMEEEDRGILQKPKLINRAEEAEKWLASKSIPYHWENSAIRIIGHIRNSVSE